MSATHLLPFTLVALAAALDVAANLLLTLSNGFRKKLWGVLAILLVLGAFTLLAQAIRYMDLAIAYATWGALGILGTALGGLWCFGQRLNTIGWAGILLVVTAIVVIKTG
ncbi:SMR family transporter [Ectothiorhodospira lacustris]|uniref:SMR family transporter n=1 Tax=Ectothiorhodospira lacustris TaxID=2899127 RepID=UPI001EE8AD2B|nr:SMR family transporter [Ectothiorhodospira lacustris]MCG5499762.1 SMR family transporter [Ectothiorhodospira lacustris]MCG5509781.1 SMR family transporter [Ectothiorhodospira lacustris]MCG5522305.1 SMR family transporter [Ectothiorhodospira lacustris]